MRDVFDDVKNLEKGLELPSGFYSELLKESDWSFVVKLSALFEAACAQVLAVKLQAPELESVFAYLDQGNQKCGKIKLIEKLKIITPKQSNILMKLAELRNLLVHNIKCVNFDFSIYIDSLDEAKRKNLVKLFGHGLKESIDHGGRKLSRGEFVTLAPKVALWLTASEVLACLSLEKDIGKIKKESEGLAINFFKNVHNASSNEN